MSVIRAGEIFDGEGFCAADLFIEGDRFAADRDEEPGEVIDAAGCYVIPGLVDLHFHGSAGADISDGALEGLHEMAAYEASRGVTAMCPATMTLSEEILTKAAHASAGADISDGALEGLHEMAAYEASRGVTAMCPATMTLSEEILTKAAHAAAEFSPAENEADLVGINMEGPFISPSKVGAQNPEYVRNPGVEEFRRLQEAAGGRGVPTSPGGRRRSVQDRRHRTRGAGR